MVSIPMTYKPKLDAVFDYRCNSTIRPHNEKNPKKPGDKLIIYRWSGKPYHSKWLPPINTVISEINHLKFVRNPYKGTALMKSYFATSWNPIDDDVLAKIAQDDFIDPPTADELRLVLMKLNQLPTLIGSWFDIIKWRIPRKVA